jgi:4-diphosphocytidyl-2-C-methyl-D-erythritol kinase
MEGRGERVERVHVLPTLAVLLVNPGIAVPTGAVFGKLGRRTGIGMAEKPRQPLETLWDVDAYLDGTQNDLEGPSLQAAPAITEVLDALEDEDGCVIARMSGSGATCFGLFDGRHLALRAAENLAVEHPTWWVRATRIAPPDIGAPHWLA